MIDKIPTSKEELFAYPIDSSLVDNVSTGKGREGTCLGQGEVMWELIRGEQTETELNHYNQKLEQ